MTMCRIAVSSALALCLLSLLAPDAHAQVDRDVAVFRRDQPVPTGRKLAVVVGLDAYESLPPLGFAERDANDMDQELTSLGFLVTRLTGAGEVKPATKRSVLHRVEEMCREAKKHAGDGTLIFYFSGHGFEAADGGVFVCPYATDPGDLPGTALSLEVVQAALVASGVRQRLLIVDMCRSRKGKSGDDARTMTLARFARAEGTGLLFSTAPGQQSFEPEAGMKDERGHPIQNGLFTHYLLRGLRGEADKGRRSRTDGFISFRELAYFVADGLADLGLQQSALRQVPYLRWDGTSEDVLLRDLGASAGDASVDADAPELPRATPGAVRAMKQVWENSLPGAATALDGRRGGAGRDASGAGRDGGDGDEGSPGEHGREGGASRFITVTISRGRGVGTLNLRFQAGGDLLGEFSVLTADPVSFEFPGARGGNGGAGGAGGPGGDGADGRDGRTRGGKGGDGGRGGPGAPGGDGGRGGAGPQIQVVVVGDEDLLKLARTSCLIRSSGGPGGIGGSGGDGGRGGFRGTGGLAESPFGSDGDDGQEGGRGDRGGRGRDGAPGLAGAVEWQAQR